jgi:hypothetical protein
MIGEPIEGEGAIYESNYDKGRVGKNSGKGSKSDVSAISSDGVEDSDKGNTSIRIDRVQDSGLGEGDTGTVREQGDSSSEGERTRVVDNNITQQKQQQTAITDITRVDVEWSIFLLQKWYNRNIELAEAITYGLPDLKTPENLNIGLVGLPDIRAIQQDALRKLQQKAESDITITKPIMPTREPIHPFLQKLVSKIRVGDDYDVDILTTSDIQYLMTIINKFATLQLTVAQSIRTLQTKVKVLPKPKQAKVEQAQIKQKVVSSDEELEKELESISHEETHD